MTETMTRDLLDSSASDLARLLAARKVSALELADEAIARIEARDRAINAVVVRDFDRARGAARAADAALARGERGALLGVPMTVKESNWVAGTVTNWGMEFWSDWTADRDAVGIVRLKEAGAVILGKTNVPPMLGDWQSDNPVHGRTNNPWDLGRSPGGSSGGGAAAVAAGMVPLEFGSDIGGSIRVPAAFCGVYGHKPSYGIIPLSGHEPPGIEGLDVPLAVVGPLARTVEDLERAMDVLVGPPAHEAIGYRLELPAARHTSLRDFRVLVLDGHPRAALDDEVKAALLDLADRLRGAGVPVTHGSPLVPDLAFGDGVYRGILDTVLTRGAPSSPDPMTAHRYMELLEHQRVIQRLWAKLFGGFDVVLMPVFGTPAFPHDPEPNTAVRKMIVNGEETRWYSHLAWAGPATLGGLPSTAAPIGFTQGGLPIGVQVMGPYLEDRTTLAFAAALERAFGGFTPPPGY
jgi:amidase